MLWKLYVIILCATTLALHQNNFEGTARQLVIPPNVGNPSAMQMAPTVMLMTTQPVAGPVKTFIGNLRYKTQSAIKRISDATLGGTGFHPISTIRKHMQNIRSYPTTIVPTMITTTSTTTTTEKPQYPLEVYEALTLVQRQQLAAILSHIQANEQNYTKN